MAKSSYTLGDLPPPLYPEYSAQSVDADSYYYGTLAVDSEGAYAIDTNGEYAVSIDEESVWHRFDENGVLIETPSTDDVISTITMCDICGTIFGRRWKPTKRGRLIVCRLCLDEDRWDG